MTTETVFRGPLRCGVECFRFGIALACFGLGIMQDLALTRKVTDFHLAGARLKSRA